MQAISDELAARLKDKFQAGKQGFRARVELDLVALTSEPTNVALGKTVSVVPLSPAGNTCPLATVPAGAATNGDITDFTRIDSHVGADGQVHGADWTLDLGSAYEVESMRLKLIVGVGGGNVLPDPTVSPSATDEWRGNLRCSDDGSSWTDVSVTYTTTGASDTVWGVWTLDTPLTHRYWQMQARWTSPSGIHFIVYCGFGEWEINALAVETTVTTVDLPEPTAISIDKSLRRAADQADITIPNEALPLGWGTTSEVVTNCRVRIFQWYGHPDNEVQTFTGLVDNVADHRDYPTTTLTCRDLFAILIDQTFSSNAPQTSGESGAVRTAANGVYLAMEISDIVSDILDKAGWPTADRDITETSYVLDEFIVSDGASWADTIIGDERLTGLVGYSAWADELGVFHFAPTAISQNLTEPLTPVYTFATGVDIVALDDRTDQYDLRTRVKVRGPLTTQTLTDTWRELWRTTKITKPVGLWYAPAEPTILRVISRATKRMYRLRQSDRVILGSVYLGGVIPHPLGLSGDPADATIYWVLDAPWIYTGTATGNSVKKVRKADNVVLATYSLPNGRISAIKVSSSYLYFTDLTTDRFYRRSKVDGSAVANYGHTYAAVSQTNPSGMMIDGSTLYVFWSNGGTTARFLKCVEGAPGTVTGAVKTAGTALHGGEMDTTTHTECYGDSDSLNLVTKDTLLEAVSQTTQVYAEVVDTDLEDELGANAQMQDREHDTHSTDADHAFEVRRLTLNLTVITNLAQATQTAQRQLDLASVRHRVLDVGIIGNPALQKTDPVAVSDPVTGISEGFAIDTYRSLMSADGTYVGTLALLPVASLDDDPDDDGDVTE